MDIKDTLLREMQEWCNAIGMNYAIVSKEILDFLGSDVVIDYLFTRDATPDFPNTLGDVFVLSQNCLYDYEVQKQGNLRHFVPLRMITGISEVFAQSEPTAELFFRVSFRYGGLGSITACVKFANKDKVRRFSNSVKSELSRIK